MSPFFKIALVIFIIDVGKNYQNFGKKLKPQKG